MTTARPFFCRMVALAVLLGAGGLIAAAERGPQLRINSAAPAEAEARVIVKFRADSGLVRIQSATTGTDALPRHAQALAARLGLGLRDGRALGPRSQLIHGSGINSADLALRLSAQADVEYAVADERKRPSSAPNDPLYANGQTATTPVVGQWFLRAPDATIVSAINAEAAWGITTGKPGVVVAVLDTGVRPEHPDLAGKLLPGYDFVANVAASNDGDGRDADATDPGDYVTTADVGTVAGCTAADVGNSSWHGTETAGLIAAATNNGIGIAGVGRDVRLLPLRVFGKCGGYDSDIQDAMRWAAGLSVPGLPINPNPAKVLNLSLGGTQSCSAAYQDVVAQMTALNIVVVAAAGNEGLAVTSPANCPGVVAVGGVRHAGTKVGYSNLGPDVTLSAPAGNCVNTAGTCLYPLVTTSNNGPTGPGASTYTSGGNDATLGTSFSTPLVVGTVALMFSAIGTLTPAEVIAALKASARLFPTTGADASVKACKAPSAVPQDSECYCTTSTCGAGLLDAGAAAAAIAKAVAHVSVASTAVTAGTAVALDGSASHASVDHTIIGYAWTISSGAGIASFSPAATNAPTVTLLPTAAGSVTVTLAITDSANQQDTTSTTLVVSAAPVAPPPSSGGGGAMEFGWLLGWLASVLGVWVVTPRSRR